MRKAGTSAKRTPSSSGCRNLEGSKADSSRCCSEYWQHQELSDILRRQPDLRQAGTKETKIRTLWEAQLSEATFLGELTNRQLEEVLQRLGLKISGAKNARMGAPRRPFRTNALNRRRSTNRGASARHSVGQPCTRIRASRPTKVAFRLRASNPQGSLQPWLDDLLGAGGLVRCYATEDSNPTKQLKNKLSQAAAARDGLLVLLLADDGAYMKAREALVERWMTNSEWPKSVACIAPCVSPWRADSASNRREGTQFLGVGPQGEDIPCGSNCQRRGLTLERRSIPVAQIAQLVYLIRLASVPTADHLFSSATRFLPPKRTRIDARVPAAGYLSNRFLPQAKTCPARDVGM